MLQVGAWLPVMWIGKRPLRNERRVGEHLRPARAVNRAAGGLVRRRGTEQRKRAPDVDVVPVEADALLGEGADVGRDPRVGVVDHRVVEARVVPDYPAQGGASERPRRRASALRLQER